MCFAAEHQQPHAPVHTDPISCRTGKGRALIGFDSCIPKSPAHCKTGNGPGASRWRSLYAMESSTSAERAWEGDTQALSQDSITSQPCHMSPPVFCSAPGEEEPYPRLCLSPQNEYFAPLECHAIKASTTCSLQPAAEARHPPRVLSRHVWGCHKQDMHALSWFTSFLHRLSLEPVKAALVVRGSFAMHVSSPNPVSLREQSLCWSLCPCGSQPAWAKPPLKGILRKGCFPCLLPVLQTGDWKLGNDLSASISHIYSMPDNPHRRCGVIHHNRWINECRSWGKCFMFQISSLFQMFTIYNWKAKWKLLLLTDNSHQVLGQPLKSRRHIWPRNGAKH